MNTRTVAFIGCIGMSPKALLDQFQKLTPGNSGVWGNLKGVGEVKNAQIVVVLEGLPPKFNRQLLKNKIVICFPLEPPVIRAVKNFPLGSIKCYLETHPFVCHFLGFLSPKINYDELKLLPYTPHPRRLCIICSNIKLTPSHIARYKFVLRLARELPWCDLYGFGWDEETPSLPNYKGAFGNGYRGQKINSPYKNKLDILSEYQYVIVIENSQHHNYFTEKLTDAILGWSYPLYYGAPNIKGVLPPHSVTCINIENYDKAKETIQKTTAHPPTQQMIEGLTKARNDILDTFNIWPAVSKQIKRKPL